MVLIDTSAWIEALRKKGDPKIRQEVDLNLRNGNARLTEPVLVELFHGARGQQEISFLEELKESVPILSCNEACFAHAIDLSKKSRRKGITVSSMDILIFAVASHYQVPTIHKDRHFELLMTI